jgi:hypothetical protein
MGTDALTTLKENACASIRYRVRKEILGERSPAPVFLDDILADGRVRYVLGWQRADGYLGEVFHGGWIPEEKRKFSATGAESGLRFLAEMGLPATHPAVEKGLHALLQPGWNAGKTSWNTYAPEIGLFGDDYIRAVVFAYYGLENHNFSRIEVERALDRFRDVLQVRSLDEITGTYRDKRYFAGAAVLPDIYHLRLLAFTYGWRNSGTTELVARAVRRLTELSPVPAIYVKYRSRLIAPAAIYPRDLGKSLQEFGGSDWFPWLHTMELLARTGIVGRVPALKRQALELRALLEADAGPFATKPDERGFRKWSVYTGLALEEEWKSGKWKNDLTFRALLILKYAGLLR